MAGLKRYLVFAYNNYYPDGGWQDFAGHCDTLEEVETIIPNITRDYWQVVDTHLPEPEVIKFGRCRFI